MESNRFSSREVRDVREVFFWKGSTAFAHFAFFAAKPVRIHSVYSVVELKMVAPSNVGCATLDIRLSKIKLAHSSATFQVRKHTFKASGAT